MSIESLYRAVATGDAAAVQALLDAGADPGWTNFYGDSLTTIARDRGHAEIAALLEGASAHSARVVPSATRADHPIHLAAEAGDVRRVRSLLDADPTLLEIADRSGGTPLHRAAIGCWPRVVELLLARGAAVHAVHGGGLGSGAGYAPENLQAIDLAIWGGPSTVATSPRRRLVYYTRRLLRRRSDLAWARPWRAATARLLIGYGAAHDLPTAAALGDVDRVTAILDADPGRLGEQRPNGRRALTAAITFGHDDIAGRLLRCGFDPCWPEVVDEPRGAALHTAARQGNEAMVTLLLDHGADPSACVNAGGNAVFAAKTPALRRLLIDRGGTIDPFDLVWLDEDDEVMRRVTADPAAAEAGCGGVFTAVVTRGKHDLLKRLLDAGFRVPARVDGCHSYLFERPDMLRTLLASGMSPDLPGSNGLRPLHELCSRDTRNRTMSHRTEIAGILLDAGAAISPRDDEYQSTPLAWAARNDLPDMVEFLLSRGAPANLPDDPPWATPLAWARRRGHAQIVELLSRSGAVN
jgi:ankyrin repeat protein